MRTAASLVATPSVPRVSLVVPRGSVPHMVKKPFVKKKVEEHEP
jgi:hypothetical protein